MHNGLSKANCKKFIDLDNMEVIAESTQEFSNMGKMRWVWKRVSN
ncbi:hypothetical protein SAMN06265377_3015 [Flagellimonas pacifica]|uniref:Uncharacterized protein n=1 Tax=Flagellimonas pacifica TaxID=1247520 RepID=A0A285MVG2_9FLAO|nr:hypothetical protein SAMN06265377_3015 [Allomuricauda parva]